MASVEPSNAKASLRLWRYPYILLTVIAIPSLLFGLYMIVGLAINDIDYDSSLNSGNLISSLMLIGGSALLLAKQKIGIFVYFASIAVFLIVQTYSQAELYGDKFQYPDFVRQENLPSNIAMIGIPIALLILGWKKVKW